MNIKRAFLAAVAVLMVPGFAMAQSVTYFDTGVSYQGLEGEEVPMVDATITCNAGLPLTQTAPVGDNGGADRVNFTVTDFVPGSCEVTFGSVPAGWAIDGVRINGDLDTTLTSCLFDDGTNGEPVGATQTCTASLAPGAVGYSVDVEWDFTDDADMSLADSAMVAIMCTGATYISTTLDASPDSTVLPAEFDVTPESSCEAYLMNVGSAVVSDDDSCDVDFLYGDTSDVACVITAGVFYEGIPTLSQYGMAIMALLMLAVGFVGFRRFV